MAFLVFKGQNFFTKVYLFVNVGLGVNFIILPPLVFESWRRSKIASNTQCHGLWPTGHGPWQSWLGVGPLLTRDVEEVSEGNGRAKSSVPTFLERKKCVYFGTFWRYVLQEGAAIEGQYPNSQPKWVVWADKGCFYNPSWVKFEKWEEEYTEQKQNGWLIFNWLILSLWLINRAEILNWLVWIPNISTMFYHSKL